MESLTPRYDSPTSEPVVSFYTPSVTDDVAFINSLLMQLIKTVDIDELLTVYHRHIRQVLPATALSLGCHDRCLNRGLKTGRNTHAVALAIADHTQESVEPVPVMRYWFSRSLSHNEKNLLDMLHQAISHPVLHGLSFMRLTQLATKDALTGLGNRAAFNEDCERAKHTAARDQRQFGLLVIDLDNFKTVNDQYGHDEGDKVLMSFANALTHSLRANEHAYRFGGDEFCCLLNTDRCSTMGLVAKRILHNAATSHLLERHNVTASIGGTVYLAEESVTHTFKRADQALYDVKQQGKHGYLLK